MPVRFLADRNLKHELRMVMKRFRPATASRDVISTNPAGNPRSLSKATKKVVKEDDDSSLLENLHGLEQQPNECASFRAKVVKELPDEFSVNATVDGLPHNANLHLWKKRKDPACPLCHCNQSLLNNCTVARDLRRLLATTQCCSTL
jgi:hypothetical protein